MSTAQPTARRKTGLLSNPFIRDYGMIFVLLALGGLFSILTVKQQHPTGEDAETLSAAMRAAGVNALTVSAHKIYGPKGAAALVLDKRIELKPLISGGGQERNLRSGTENVAAIAGFGAACELATARLEADGARLGDLRGRRSPQGFRQHGIARRCMFLELPFAIHDLFLSLLKFRFLLLLKLHFAQQSGLTVVQKGFTFRERLAKFLE